MVKQKLRKILPLILGILWLTELWPTSALGLASNRIGLRPGNDESDYHHGSGWLMYEVDPVKVTEIKDTTRILNLSDNEVLVKLEAVDAVLTSSGGFALLDSKSDNENLGSWVVWDEEPTLTLPPQSNKLVHFTIKIPAGAEVGDHIGGLTIQEIDSPADPTIKKGGTSVRVRTRVGLRMYLTLLGDIERAFKIRGVKFYGAGDQMAFRVTTQNLGNIRTDLKLDAKIYGIFGRYDVKEDIGIGQIFPKKKVIHNVNWPGKDRPLFGPYLAVMTFRDAYEPMSKTLAMPPAPKPVTKWVITFFIPYTQTIVVLILAFLLWFFIQLRRWLRLVKLARMPVVAYKVKKGDHLVDIAEEYDINWKLLAAMNDIKPPHSLRHIATIYVPDARGTRRDVPVISFIAYLLKPFAKWLKRGKPYQTIVVEKGDKIADIEKFTGMSWTELLEYNNLSTKTSLKVGMELKVPRRRRRKRFR